MNHEDIHLQSLNICYYELKLFLSQFACLSKPLMSLMKINNIVFIRNALCSPIFSFDFPENVIIYCPLIASTKSRIKCHRSYIRADNPNKKCFFFNMKVYNSILNVYLFIHAYIYFSPPHVIVFLSVNCRNLLIQIEE